MRSRLNVGRASVVGHDTAPWLYVKETAHARLYQLRQEARARCTRMQAHSKSEPQDCRQGSHSTAQMNKPKRAEDQTSVKQDGACGTLSLYPICLKNRRILASISSKRACDHSACEVRDERVVCIDTYAHSRHTRSIWLTATMICVTPRARTRRPCSRVCPPNSNPVSNSPRVALMTRMATSAYMWPHESVMGAEAH